MSVEQLNKLSSPPKTTKKPETPFYEHMTVSHSVKDLKDNIQNAKRSNIKPGFVGASGPTTRNPPMTVSKSLANIFNCPAETPTKVR
jgi:hypothetical protein